MEIYVVYMYMCVCMCMMYMYIHTDIYIQTFNLSYISIILINFLKFLLPMFATNLFLCSL